LIGVGSLVCLSLGHSYLRPEEHGRLRRWSSLEEGMLRTVLPVEGRLGGRVRVGEGGWMLRTGTKVGKHVG